MSQRQNGWEGAGDSTTSSGLATGAVGSPCSRNWYSAPTTGVSPPRKWSSRCESGAARSDETFVTNDDSKEGAMKKAARILFRKLTAAVREKVATPKFVVPAVALAI